MQKIHRRSAGDKTPRIGVCKKRGNQFSGAPSLLEMAAEWKPAQAAFLGSARKPRHARNRISRKTQRRRGDQSVDRISHALGSRQML